VSLFLFLRDVTRRPKQMGAIAPSGAELGRVMVEAAQLRPDHVIAELGAGTGSITAAIRHAVPTAPLLAFEPGKELAEVLRNRFPDVRIDERLAHEMPAALAEWGHPKVDRVLSGLPWTIWSEAEQDQILSSVAGCMQPDGRLVTFTYVHSQVLKGAGSLKALLERHFETVERTRTAWMNVPPAFAWVGVGPKR
jgi:phosphatidylethanolamine/phosphatidyl-N-methylethanolamine N-methyltransferase